MLPKKRRLSAAEVREVLARGKTFRVGQYVGKLLAGRPTLGVAVIVSKKVARKATSRNTLRRKAYLELESLTLPPSGSLALFVKTPQK
ncbi:MAG: ribonuclease P protein component [bacterium]|nr:ribonuclease P protein component [bacterium]